MTRKYPSLACVLCIVAGYILLGCGANLTIELPNGHYVVVANANDVAINSGSGDTVTKHSVGELADSGDHVYGTIVDPDTLLFQEYFLLDTRTSTISYYPDEASWSAALHVLSIANRDLRGPSAIYNMVDQVWWRVVLLGLVILLLFVPLWIWRRLTQRAASNTELISHAG